VSIADERGKFDMPGFLRRFPTPLPLIAAITASELLHGVERARDGHRRLLGQRHVEQILASITVQPFDLPQARCHARLWADLETRGTMIGAHDLLIAATGLALGHDVATLNTAEFQRVAGLRVLDATPFCLPLPWEKPFVRAAVNLPRALAVIHRPSFASVEGWTSAGAALRGEAITVG
jgi:tRNA(fMet)-specific endonuclease VapC